MRKILLLLIPFLFLLIGCKNHIEKNAPVGFEITDSLASILTFDTVNQTKVTDQLQLVGEISFNEDKVTRVYPSTSGVAQSITVSLGDYVQKGQTLCVLRSADIAGTQGDLAAALSDSVSAKKNLDATQDLFTNGLASEPDLINSKTAYQKSLSLLKKLRMQLNISNGENGDAVATVRAPESGYILEKKINNGMFVRSDNSEILFSIGELTDVWVLANVYEGDIDKIKPGVEADITTLSYPDKKFKGKVDKIANLLDPASKVMKVRIQLNNSEHLLKPGMFANIGLQFPENIQMLSLQSSTVLFDDNKYYVVRYRNKKNVSMQLVNVFKTFGDISYVSSDSLKADDVVLNKNALFVFTALKKL